MALILSLESSSEVCSVAISDDGVLLHKIETKEAFSHTRKMTLFIHECLKAVNLSIRDLSAVAVSHGPGSYTGLRVSAATAKGLCYGLVVPLIAVDTLKAVAWWARSQEGAAHYIPMIDARRMEVYTAVYDAELNPVEKTHNLIIDEASYGNYAGPDTILCGTGVEKCRSMLQSRGFKLMPCDLSAEMIISLAHEQFAEENFENVAAYAPNYFKAPKVTTSKKPLF